MLISNMTTLFQTYCPKYPNKAILVPKLILFVCFAQFFAFRHILGLLISNIAIAFSNFHLKIPKRTFLVSNLRIYIFRRNFFKLRTQNYGNKACLVPKSKLFMLHDLSFHKFEGKIRILFTFLA